MEKEKTIYNMKLHEELAIGDNTCDCVSNSFTTYVLRVHEGWIYTLTDAERKHEQSVYVPLVAPSVPLP